MKSAHLGYAGSQGIVGARCHQNIFTGKQFSQVRISGRHYLTPYHVADIHNLEAISKDPFFEMAYCHLQQIVKRIKIPIVSTFKKP